MITDAVNTIQPTLKESADNSLRAKAFLLFSLLCSVGFLLRYLIAFQDVVYLDRLFIPDDTFYILSISRSIANGFGPTTDGVHLTSGFQPLISFLQLPFFWLGFNTDKALIFAIYLSAFWGSLSTLVLGYLIKNLSNYSAAIFGCLLWIFCPIILNNDLNGMETSLAGFLNLAAILLVILIDKQSTTLRLTGLGLVCGLAFLARVDSCFLILVIAVFTLLRWGFSKTLFYLFLAFIVVLPWWVYAFTTFGSIVPESGIAIKGWLNLINRSAEFNSMSSLYALIEWFPLFRENTFFAFSGIFLTFYLIGRGSYFAGIYGYLILLPLIFLFAFYTFYLPAFWFFTRYYYLIYAFIIICLSLVLTGEPWLKNRLLYFGFLMLILGVYLINIASFFSKPEKAEDGIIGSIKGYREVALEITKHFKPGDIVGSFQSGALGFYVPKYVRIINLDGVVNKKAAEALKSYSLKSYVNSQHMNRFADWEFSSYFFQNTYGIDFPAGCFNTLFRAKSQGSQHFVLRHYQPKC
ncbi:MAG: glycosyltransferase family 39 protein [Tatlockia sp.]|nr:glycosyltransferase family 39 protein [Tatlockia sp.]